MGKHYTLNLARNLGRHFSRVTSNTGSSGLGTSPSASEWSIGGGGVGVDRIRLQRSDGKSAVFSLLTSSGGEGFKTHGLSHHDKESIPTETIVTKEDLLKFYREAWLIRRMELAADALYKTRAIRGFCHLGIGQEAIAVGIQSIFDNMNDALITAYRCHGFALLRGASVRSILAELLGRRSGVSGGKGGSMHMFAPRFYGGNGIVGAQVPIGVGLAFSQWYRRHVFSDHASPPTEMATDNAILNCDENDTSKFSKRGENLAPSLKNERNKKSHSRHIVVKDTSVDSRDDHHNDSGVTFALYGDGAANQGQLFEALNIAALHKLPVVLVCENNFYAMGTSIERSAASTSFYTRGDYVPGLQVDAMDTLAVREASKFARNWAISGRGPIILEMMTYRYHGHSMSDPGTTYRTRDEIQRVRSDLDPLRRLSSQIIAASFASESELKEIEESIKLDVESAVKEASSDAFPDVVSDLYTDVYVTPNPADTMSVRGVTLD